MGEYFLNSLIADIDSLALYGGIHPRRSGFHWMLASRFPWAIYYRMEKEEVVVRAVVDCRRDPARVAERLNLNRQFYVGGSADGSEAFGHRWETNSVLVTDGTVILCRLSSDRTKVYALEIASQDVQRARL